MGEQQTVQITPKPVTQSANTEAPPENISPEPQKKSKTWIIIVFVLLFLSVSGVAGYFVYQNHQLKKEVKTSSVPSPTSTVAPTDTAQANQPEDQKQPCLGKTRFTEVEDNLEDEIDSATQWKRFTSKKLQISFLYPPKLIRSSQYYWSYPRKGTPLEGAEIFMTISDQHSQFNSLDDMNRVLNMKVNEEVSVNIGSDEEFKIKKIGEKKEGNFSGSIYQNIIAEQNYWHQFYSFIFISDILIRDKRLVIQYNFKTEKERDNSRDDFIKIVNSLRFEDFDAGFIKSLGLVDVENNVEFSDTDADGGIYYLNKVPDNISDLEGELFQLEKQNNKVFGYVISRNICLNDLVGKRMIVVLRMIKGLTINNRNVYFVDDINVV